MSGPPPAPRRILVIQLRRFGDAVITTALLEDLRRAFPEAGIDFLTTAAIAPLLRGHPFLDECVVYRREHPLRTWSEIRKRGYDWIVDSESSPRSAMLAVAAGSPVRVGWAVTGWRWLYTHRVSRRANRPPQYVVLDRQRLLAAVGVPVVPTRPRLTITDEERSQGDAELAASGALPGRPHAGLLLSAGRRSKEWPVERFAELAGSLAGEGVTPVLFEMPGEGEKTSALLRRTAAPVRARVEDARHFLRMLSACQVLISGDTGPVHMATAIGIPTVTIFGPSDPAGWSPQLPITTVVRAETSSCLECRRNASDVAHACMAGVDAGTVLARAREYLNRAPDAVMAAARSPTSRGP